MQAAPHCRRSMQTAMHTSNHTTPQVFLSATLSNAAEFAAWVAHLHKQPCHVVFTDYRPTPLQHYAFPLGMPENEGGLYLVRVLSLSLHVIWRTAEYSIRVFALGRCSTTPSRWGCLKMREGCTWCVSPFVCM